MDKLFKPWNYKVLKTVQTIVPRYIKFKNSYIFVL